MRPQQGGEITLRDLLQNFYRRRRIFYYVTASVFILGVLYCLVCTRRYVATGVVQLQEQSSDKLGLDNPMAGAGGAAASDALTQSIDLQTQVKILQSDNLALATINALHMEGTEDFKPRFPIINWVMNIFTPSSVADPKGVPLEDAPHRRSLALGAFARHLTVKNDTGTRLIDIDYANPDPKLAAAVVNSLSAELTDYTFQTRYDATKQASRWLGNQLSDLRKTSNDLQAKVVQLQRESGLYGLGVVDAQGRPQAFSAILAKLQDSTTTLSAAEQNKILKGAIAHAAASGDAELLSGLAGNTTGQNAPAVNNSLAVIQNLRAQEAAQETALQEAEAKFGPNYPRLTQLRAGIAGLRQSIKDEVRRVDARAQSDFRVASEAESKTRSDYDNAKKQADLSNNKSIELEIAREEADQSRALYNDLLRHLNEAGILEGLKASNVTVVDPARPVDKPTSPSIPLVLLGSLIAGMFLGFVSVLLIDSLDNKISRIEDTQEMFGESLLGALPLVPESKGRPEMSLSSLVARDAPKSPYVEALRSLRTALQLSQADRSPSVILVTSSVEGEGKTTCAINLATLMAQGGRRTLLVDTDLRRGTLRERAGLSSGPGLSELLAGQISAPPIQTFPGVPGLSVLAAGGTPPNPSDLLDSAAMHAWIERWRKEYDAVIFDSAPVLPVTDSVTLNPFTDATVLLARSGVTLKTQTERSYGLLRMSGKHYVGVVLNGLTIEEDSYNGSRKSGYSYGEDKVASA